MRRFIEFFVKKSTYLSVFPLIFSVFVSFVPDKVWAKSCLDIDMQNLSACTSSSTGLSCCWNGGSCLPFGQCQQEDTCSSTGAARINYNYNGNGYDESCPKSEIDNEKGVIKCVLEYCAGGAWQWTGGDYGPAACIDSNKHLYVENLANCIGWVGESCNYECVECTEDSHCSGSKTCDTTSHTCKAAPECATHSDCKTPTVSYDSTYSFDGYNYFAVSITGGKKYIRGQCSSSAKCLYPLQDVSCNNGYFRKQGLKVSDECAHCGYDVLMCQTNQNTGLVTCNIGGVYMALSSDYKAGNDSKNGIPYGYGYNGQTDCYYEKGYGDPTGTGTQKCRYYD